MRSRIAIWCAVSTKAQAEEQKDSLIVQEQDGRAFAERENGEVVAVLRVPGHSRRYLDFDECAQHAAKKGITAFLELADLWKRKAFDVLWVRDGDRFAREQALHSNITTKIIRIGARVYSSRDGWVDKKNYRMWSAMNGYKASVDVDQLVEYRRMGLTKRAKDGFPSSHIPFSHRMIRDENGKAVRLEVKEELRTLFDDLADLFLEGVGWKYLSHTLHHRLGHRMYPQSHFYQLLFNPYFWGNSAQDYWKKRGLWAFDPTIPAPDGTKLYYGTHEPVYTGELAEKVKAEMRRRCNIITGSSRPDKTNKFSGLMICAECGHNLIIHSKLRSPKKNPHTFRFYACTMPLPLYRKCSQRTIIAEDDVQEYIDLYLAQLEKRGSPDMIRQDNTEDERKERLFDEIEALKRELKTTISDKATAPTPSARRLYDEQLMELSMRLDVLEKQVGKIGQDVESRDEIETQKMAFHEFLAMKRELLWQKPSTEINQFLHRIMGKKRFYVLKGKIIRVDYPIPRK